jgi:hypothetical protein
VDPLLATKKKEKKNKEIILVSPPRLGGSNSSGSHENIPWWCTAFENSSFKTDDRNLDDYVALTSVLTV